MKMNRTERLARRMAEHDAILARFPKGGRDSLDKVQPLGQTFSRIDGITSQQKTRVSFKRFGNK